MEALTALGIIPNKSFPEPSYRVWFAIVFVSFQKHITFYKELFTFMTKTLEDSIPLMKQRKQDHIRICQTQNVESDSREIFNSYEFEPEALPEMNMDVIDSTQLFLGQTFAMPMLITGMTGGVENGKKINEILAKCAEMFNIPMGLGSQKMMIKDRSLKSLFDVRHVAPSVFLIGNMGAVSLNYGVTEDDILQLVDECKLNAFALHLNALQECVQPEGERNFSQLLKRIEVLAKKLPVPLMIKEVGSGMSASTFLKLIQTGVSAVDVGGKGGTSWSAIEGMRSSPESLHARLGELFRHWGYRTDESLVSCSEVLKKHPWKGHLVATGGIRHGLHVAKCVALGATMAGIGLPLFRAAVDPKCGLSAKEAVEEELNFFKYSLHVAMFCCGAQRLTDLKYRLKRTKN